MQTSESEPKPPKVVAHLSPDGIHLIVERCPHCQKRHKHGAGRDPKNPLYGHRTGHCDRDIEQPGYLLVAPGTPTVPPASEPQSRLLRNGEEYRAMRRADLAT